VRGAVGGCGSRWCLSHSLLVLRARFEFCGGTGVSEKNNSEGAGARVGGDEAATASFGNALHQAHDPG
jgi:hypothetical protein